MAILPTIENIFTVLITFSKYLGLLLQLVIFKQFITFCKHKNNNILSVKGFKRDKRKYEPCNWKQGLYPFFQQKIQGLFTDFQGHISHCSRTPFSAKKGLESMSCLVLPQHEQFHPKGLSLYAPFSLNFYLNYKISIEIQKLSYTDCNFQGLSRCVQTKWKDFTAVAIAIDYCVSYLYPPHRGKL